MTNPNNQTEQMPTTITLGGVAYSISENPELLALVTAIRTDAAKIEKAKLHSKIQEVQEQVKRLKDVNIEPIATPNNLEIGEITEAFSKLIDQKLQPIFNNQKRQEELSVNDYRNKLITENQLACIPELVVGNTKEELDAALAQSIELRNKYAAVSNVAALSTTNPASTIAPKPADIVPAPIKPVVPPSTSSAAEAVPLNIKSLSAKEFAANRDNLFKEIEALVEG